MNDGYNASAMSLRDYFAGQAIAGRATSVDALDRGFYSRVARDAYRYADALLEAKDMEELHEAL